MSALLILLGLTFAVVIILVVGSLKSDVGNLRRELRGLAGKLDQLERSRIQPHPVGAGAPAVAEKKPTPASVAQPSREVEAIPSSAPQAPSVPLIVPPPPAPTRTRGEWEALIGGKFLNRIGALALIMGMGFFLKYAFDRDWITEWMRVGIGIGVGVLLLAGGRRFHRKGLPMFAQGLVGAGIAILYLSIYASFNFYHLVSQPVAFGLMSVVTALTFTQAIYYDALAVSLLGWLGGFLTPFLLSTGEAQPVGLFSYITMLDVGLIAVLVLRRKWSLLAPLSLVATYFIYYLWYASSAGDSDGVAAVAFLSIFWILFHGYDCAGEILRNEPSGVLYRVTAVAHIVILYPGLYVIVDRYFSPWLAPVTFVLAALYIGSWFLLRRSSGRHPAAATQYAITGIVLLVIGTEIQFGDFVVITAYIVEAVVLFWLGRRASLKHLWTIGIGVLLWACLMVLVTDNTFYFYDADVFVLLCVLAFLLDCVRGGRCLCSRRKRQ